MRAVVASRYTAEQEEWRLLMDGMLSMQEREEPRQLWGSPWEGGRMGAAQI